MSWQCRRVVPGPTVSAIVPPHTRIASGDSLSGYPRRTHSAKPPTSGRTRVTPSRSRRSASLALVASLGQVQ